MITTTCLILPMPAAAAGAGPVVPGAAVGRVGLAQDTAIIAVTAAATVVSLFRRVMPATVRAKDELCNVSV